MAITLREDRRSRKYDGKARGQQWRGVNKRHRSRVYRVQEGKHITQLGGRDAAGMGVGIGRERRGPPTTSGAQLRHNKRQESKEGIPPTGWKGMWEVTRDNNHAINN